MNMMMDKRAAQKSERVRKLGANGAWIGQIHDDEMAKRASWSRWAKKLTAFTETKGRGPMWSEA